MRGEYRASELRLTGPEVSLGLAGNGRLDWPAARMGFDPDRLQIEKVAIEDGRVDFADGAQRRADRARRVLVQGRSALAASAR